MSRRSDRERRAVVAAMTSLQERLTAEAYKAHKVGNIAGSVAYFAAASHARHMTEEPGQEIP